MRRIPSRDDRNTGLGAAAKAAAIVLAVAVLALVAGRPVDPANVGRGTPGLVRMPETARQIVPLVRGDVPPPNVDSPQLREDLLGAPRMLALAPAVRPAPGTKPGVAPGPAPTAEEPAPTF
jgi:hypothetical protein